MADEDEERAGPPAKSPKYDQEFFLGLAAKGKDVWNAWRRDPANKEVPVTLAGVDFSEAPRDKIDFSGFEFGGGANFSRCKWRGVQWSEIRDDTEAFKPGRACFTGAAFGGFADFGGAAFGNGAYFRGAAFGNGAYFRGAALGHFAHFGGAAFGHFADFTGAAFGGFARFGGAAFGDRADFTGAAFGDLADFDGARFKGDVHFRGKTAGQLARDLGLIPDGVEEINDEQRELGKRLETSWETHGSGPDRFLLISFSGARFDGPAIFTGRTFAGEADFTQARFYSPPDFESAADAGKIDTTHAHIGFVPAGWWLHWTMDSAIPVRLRRLRKLAEETKNHDLERDLYIEERKAERGVYWRQLRRQLSNREELANKLKEIAAQKYHVWLEWRLNQKARYAHWLLAKPAQLARLITHCLWIAVMGAYWALSNYGRSVLWPLVLLVLSVPAFNRIYTAILAQLLEKAPDVDKYQRAVWMLALGNTVPFIGPLTIDPKLKQFLFCLGDEKCPPIPPEGYQFAVLSQNLVSLILFFFIGLALRNYFKIK
ncbi:MAG: hypothetical protein L0Y50_08610 [Beijerinckiaceae bacterium]|nr:hypothetical protein [Beijerinckiaceae bacterium]